MQSRALARHAARSLVVFVSLCAVHAGSVRAEEIRDQPPTYRGSGEPIVAPTGLQIGARAGYGLGSGDVYRGLNVSDGSNGFAPLIVDVGARVMPELYVGAYGGFAWVLPKHNPVSCPDGFSCTISDWRFGVEADWHVMPSSAYDPYIGLSTGYEILHNSVSGPTQVPTPAGPAAANASAGVTDRGWEFAGLHLGADFRIARVLALGPFFTASIGEFSSHTGSTTVSLGGSPVATTDAAAVEKRPHEIYMLGLRGTVNPM